MSEQTTHRALFLKCMDCVSDFTWSVRDQEYFQEREWDPPKRCPACRILKKARFASLDGEVK